MPRGVPPKRHPSAGAPGPNCPSCPTLQFSCNQFGGQAPGTSEEERQWAFRKFGFEFPVMVRCAVARCAMPCPCRPAGQQRLAPLVLDAAGLSGWNAACWGMLAQGMSVLHAIHACHAGASLLQDKIEVNGPNTHPIYQVRVQWWP